MIKNLEIINAIVTHKIQNHQQALMLCGNMDHVLLVPMVEKRGITLAGKSYLSIQIPFKFQIPNSKNMYQLSRDHPRKEMEMVKAMEMVMVKVMEMEMVMVMEIIPQVPL